MKKILLLVLIVVVGSTAYYFQTKSNEENKALPILNPVDFNPKLVDSTLHHKGINHRVLDFELTNQFGKTVTKDIIKGKIAVVDYFFTTCPSICPKLTKEMTRVYDAFKDERSVMILSHTVMPEVDTPEVLKAYADAYEVEGENWQFLTGPKEELYRLARKSYFVAPDIDDTTFQHGGESDFIHTENVVLIDHVGQIRGVYDGIDPKEVEQLLHDVQWLIDDWHSR